MHKALRIELDLCDLHQAHHNAMRRGEGNNERMMHIVDNIDEKKGIQTRTYQERLNARQSLPYFLLVAASCTFSPPRSMSLPAPAKVLQADRLDANITTPMMAISFFMIDFLSIRPLD
jgi:site-specific recombinase XerC